MCCSWILSGLVLALFTVRMHPYYDYHASMRACVPHLIQFLALSCFGLCRHLVCCVPMNAIHSNVYILSWTSCCCVIFMHAPFPAAKPSAISHVDAAGCVGGGVRAYTALHYAAHICGGETVLVCNGSSVSDKMCCGLEVAARLCLTRRFCVNKLNLDWMVN